VLTKALGLVKNFKDTKPYVYEGVRINLLCFGGAGGLDLAQYVTIKLGMTLDEARHEYERMKARHLENVEESKELEKKYPSYKRSTSWWNQKQK